MPNPSTSEAAAEPTPIELLLLRVAHSVARHVIEGDGWTEDDACFRADLRQSEEEIRGLIREAEARGRREMREEASKFLMEKAIEFREMAGNNAGSKRLTYHEWANLLDSMNSHIRTLE